MIFKAKHSHLIPHFCPNEHYNFRKRKNFETLDTTLILSNVIHLERLYDGWFLDYKSIEERN